MEPFSTATGCCPTITTGSSSASRRCFIAINGVVVKLAGGQVNEARARSASLLAGAALAAEIFAWTAARLGAGTGRLAFLFLLGTYGYASRATTGLTDMVLTFFLMSAYIVLFPLPMKPDRRGAQPLPACYLDLRSSPGLVH